MAWDIDTIYLAHDIRMLHLKDFDHLEQRYVFTLVCSMSSSMSDTDWLTSTDCNFFRDLIPLLIALQHNNWFSGVCGDGVRVSGESWEALSRVLRCASPPHQRLSWRAASLRADHAARLGHALSRARRPPAMHTVDFSQNHIEDKGNITIIPLKL